jgi:AraC family transcriptional regulator
METPVGFELDRPPGVDESHLATVERVVAEMRERVDETLSLRSMAGIAHLSPYHFARTFRRITGIPPGEFLSTLRLQRAKELLLTTDLSASEVCYEVGYKSLGTFTSRFTQLVGVSPRRMRRLTEELSAALEGAAGAEKPPIPPEPENAGVTFRLHGDGLSGSWIFAGLFPGAVPQRRPVASVLLGAPGVYRLGPIPDGSYHLMAVALPRSEDSLDSLLPGSALRVGRGNGPPLLAQGGGVAGVAEVEMRSLRTTDPARPSRAPAQIARRSRQPINRRGKEQDRRSAIETYRVRLACE